MSFQEHAIELTELRDEELIRRLYVGVFKLDDDREREELLAAVEEGVERWAPREAVVAEMRRWYVEHDGDADVDVEMAGLLKAMEERTRLR